ESVNAWVWDEGDEVGFPRIGIEAVADQWETHDVHANLAFARRRVLNIFEAGKVHAPIGADGRARVLGAGGLSFEVVEPFEHWRVRIGSPGLDNHPPPEAGGGLAVAAP